MDKIVNLAAYRHLKEIEEVKEELLDLDEHMEVLGEFYGIPDDYEGEDE